VKDLANKHGGDLEAAGLSEPDIARMREGAVPLKWSVHHRQPLAQGGSNAPENLILIRQNANHASLTGLQNTLSAGMKPGEARDVDFVGFPKGQAVYPSNPVAPGGQ